MQCTNNVPAETFLDGKRILRKTANAGLAAAHDASNQANRAISTG